MHTEAAWMDSSAPSHAVIHLKMLSVLAVKFAMDRHKSCKLECKLIS